MALHAALGTFSSPEPAFLLVSTKNVNSGQVGFLSMRRVLVLNFQPIRFEHKRPEVRESLAFSLDLARVRILHQKKSGLLGQDCFDYRSNVWVH